MRRQGRRAGREPAEDVKRRIVAAGAAAGFEKDTARMFLRDDHRLVYVRLRRRPRGSAEVMAWVGTNGSLCGHTRITAGVRDMGMRGRDEVPLDRLGEEMKSVMEEMAKVEEAVDSGVCSVLRFGDASWGRPTDIGLFDEHE